MKLKDIIHFRKKKGLVVLTRVGVMHRVILSPYYKVMLRVRV